MTRRFVVAVVVATAAGILVAPAAHTAPLPTGKGAPTAHPTGMYLGGWAAFMVMTEHFTAGKMQELRESGPQWHVTRNEEWFDRVDYRNDSNGEVYWNFIAHSGDFTFHYWMRCTLKHRKIDCGGPNGFPDWHRKWM